MTDAQGLSSTYRVQFGKQWLGIYIWDTIEGLHSNTYYKKKDYAGAYIGNRKRKWNYHNAVEAGSIFNARKESE